MAHFYTQGGRGLSHLYANAGPINTAGLPGSYYPPGWSTLESTRAMLAQTGRIDASRLVSLGKHDSSRNGQLQAGPTRPSSSSSADRVSRFKGVSWDSVANAWRVKINSVHIGYFDEEMDAARAFDEASMTIRGAGQNVELNFPQGIMPQGAKIAAKAHYISRSEPQTRGTSAYRGVLWDKTARSWRAKIKHKGKTKYLGLHQCEIAAARAYDKAVLELRGETAHVNFPADAKLETDAEQPLSELQAKLRKARAMIASEVWLPEDDNLFLREMKRDAVLRAEALRANTLVPVKGSSVHALLMRLARATRRDPVLVGARVAVLADGDRETLTLESFNSPMYNASAMASLLTKRNARERSAISGPNELERGALGGPGSVSSTSASRLASNIMSPEAYMNLLDRLAAKLEEGTDCNEKPNTGEDQAEFAKALTMLTDAVRKRTATSAPNKDVDASKSNDTDSASERGDEDDSAEALLEDKQLLQTVAEQIRPSVIVAEIRRAIQEDTRAAVAASSASDAKVAKPATSSPQATENGSPPGKPNSEGEAQGEPGEGVEQDVAKSEGAKEVAQEVAQEGAQEDAKSDGAKEVAQEGAQSDGAKEVAQEAVKSDGAKSDGAKEVAKSADTADITQSSDGKHARRNPDKLEKSRKRRKLIRNEVEVCVADMVRSELAKAIPAIVDALKAPPSAAAAPPAPVSSAETTK